MDVFNPFDIKTWIFWTIVFVLFFYYSVGFTLPTITLMILALWLILGGIPA